MQSEAAPAAFRSWEARALLDGENATFAEGLATRVPFELPQQILWEHLDDFVLVGEDEIRHANRLMIEHTRNLVEPAGAAPLAAALKLRDRLQGKRIALVAQRRQHQPGAAGSPVRLLKRRGTPFPASRTPACAGEDLNLHDPKVTRPSTLRVYQFRHQRGGRSV